MTTFLVLLVFVLFFIFASNVLNRITETKEELTEFRRNTQHSLAFLERSVRGQAEPEVAAEAAPPIIEEAEPIYEAPQPEPEPEPEEYVVPKPQFVPPPLPVLRREPTAKVVTPTVEATAPVVHNEDEPGQFEAAVKSILSKVWNWIVVGEEHRPEGVTMEYAIASNWLLRLGILILVTGIGFFLKYSIATGLIGPEGRVALGTLSGTAMLVFGMKIIGGQYRLIGQGLCGGGVAVLYGSFFAGQYMEVLTPEVSFGMMTLVTLVAGWVAVRLDSLLVAFIGLLGGYGTPMLFNHTNENPVMLFSYVTLLGIGVLLISWKKNWRLLYYSAFIATYSIFSMKAGGVNVESFNTYFPFLVGFFVLFSTATFIFQFANREKSSLLELLFLFFNATVFSWFAYHMMNPIFPRESLAYLTIGLGIFYIAHVYVFLSRKLHDKAMLMSFIGLAAFYIAITLPIVLSKGWVTVSWAAQGFIMLWIAAKMKSPFLRNLAYLLYMIVVVRLLGLEVGRQFDGAVDYSLAGLMNRLCMFGLPVLSFYGAHRLIRSSGDNEAWGKSGTGSQILFWCMAFLAFIYLNFEFYASFGNLYTPFRLPSMTILWIGMTLVAFWQWKATGQQWLFGLFTCMVGAVMAKLLMFDVIEIFERGGFSTALVEGFAMRVVDFGSVIVLLGMLFLFFRGTEHHTSTSVFGYLGLGLFLFYSTLELIIYTGKYLPEFVQGGLSIYWALFGVGLLLGGIVKQIRHLRWVALLMLAGVIFKVFFFDLADLEQIYRIVAFIILGVVVIAGSFLYLKFRSHFELSEASS